MSIRSVAKALIIKDGKVLLNKCRDKYYGGYYAIPGGGQNEYEPLHDTLVRECMEETGYEVNPLKAVGFCETICLDKAFREKHPDRAHKVLHIFICELSNDTARIPTEKDRTQIGSEWIDINTLSNICVKPDIIGKEIDKIINADSPVFLGTEFIDFYEV